jgi:glutathione peroxidase
MSRASDRAADSLYGIDVTLPNGDVVSMARFAGQVLLIVNVASRCGFTPQYRGLEALYRKHKDRGFVVLGFPCNQFAQQEPGSDAEIQEFCSSTFGVTFPVFAKIDVNGERAHPLFVFLKSRRRGLLGASAIKWNFTKFLVDRAGAVTARFSPSTAPDAIERHIVALLG